MHTMMMHNCRTFVSLFGLVLVNLPVAFGALDCQKELFSLNLAATDWVEDMTEAITGVSISSLGADTDPSAATCDSNICSAAQYELSSTVTIDGTIAETVGIPTSVLAAAGLDLSTLSVDMSVSASLSSEFCGVEFLCDLLFGSGWESGGATCAKLDFEFDLFAPTSCDAISNYNGFHMTWGYSYALMCCPTANCNQDYFAGSSNTCDDDNDANKVAELISGVNTCWNDIQQAAMIYMKCELPKYSFDDIPESCIDTEDVFGSITEGDWTSECMPYSTVCNDDMLGIVGTLGSCLCGAVGSEDGYGDLIGTVMSFLYSSACSEVEMTCNANGGMDMKVTSEFVKFDLDLNLGLFDELDAVQDVIKYTLGQMGNVDTSYIDFDTVDDGSDTDYEVYIRVTNEEVGKQIQKKMFGDYGETFDPEVFEDNWGDVVDDVYTLLLSDVGEPDVSESTRAVTYVIGSYTEFPTSSPTPRPTTEEEASGSKDDEEDFDFGAIWDDYGIFIILGVVGLAISTACKCFCRRRNSAKAFTQNQQYVASAVNGGATGAVQQPVPTGQMQYGQQMQMGQMGGQMGAQTGTQMGGQMTGQMPAGQMQYGQQAAAGPTQMGQVQYGQVPTSAAPTV